MYITAAPVPAVTEHKASSDLDVNTSDLHVSCFKRATTKWSLSNKVDARERGGMIAKRSKTS